MTTDTETKTRENRLRRKASLYGLRLGRVCAVILMRSTMACTP